MISPLANIHKDAQIGNNVTIDPFVVIEQGVVIGDNTHVMSHAVIMKNTVIGKVAAFFPEQLLGLFRRI